jgi:multiple antibiotic resistance protein
MDDQQHALAALLRTVAIVRAGDTTRSEGPTDETPAWWLWALVLVLALNPVRAAFGIPRDGGTGRAPGGRGPAAELALLGGAAGALAIVAVALLADPLLGALDVSDPAFRIAAGIVALVTGLADVFRRLPGPDPALSGRLAALIPIALPLVARPALLVLALGAGADRGALPVLAAMVLGTAALTALAATGSPPGRGGRAVRAAPRLLAAGLVAGGVLLVLSGIFDV